jgi:hypothetical protein
MLLLLLLLLLLLEVFHPALLPLLTWLAPRNLKI